ncbi:hypothetical protein ZIOFF_065265 [Zingiber officinale]|uniref:t-SNARE coiled-coil homology domain-containing protein n=1 Tax=Zingiber officinale TaxID=94328 RepID=A0A8J5EWX6_ZINOF|nr:hypothetical protein ZIOFF_065265 [Zingiber officinale]
MSNRRTPWSNKQQQHVKPGLSRSTPNDSVSDSELEVNSVPAKHSSASVVSTTKFNSSQFEYDKDEGRGASYMGFSVERNKYKNDFRDAGGIENQSVQELENYAVYKAEETTSKLNGVLKIAEEIREDASKTLVTLHQQGEQITRTHQSAADIDHDLSRGEKLLGNLGGLFSKTWKPKKTREIRGPLLTRGPRPRSEPRHFAEPTSALEKVEVEKAKQDDTLDDLSNLLGDLKNMALDMGSEIERQHVALDAVQDDVEIVRARVKDANIRGRRLLGK